MPAGRPAITASTASTTRRWQPPSSGVGRLSNKVAEVPAPRSAVGFPASLDSDGVRRVALGNEERLPDKFKTPA